MLVGLARLMWNGHSCPLPLTVTLTLILISTDRHGEPHAGKKIRLPSVPPSLSEAGPSDIRNLSQRESDPISPRCPRRNTPTLPARSRETLRPPRRSGNAGPCPPSTHAAARRQRLALCTAAYPETTQGRVSAKRQQTPELHRPSLAGGILRPLPALARELRRETGIHPPKSSPSRTGKETRRL
jgi:hypothetical protein